MKQIHECLDLLRQLVSIPSPSQNEEEHARFIAAYLRDELAMETELQHVAGKSYNVVGRWPLSEGDAPRKLMLGGHLDTFFRHSGMTGFSQSLQLQQYLSGSPYNNMIKMGLCHNKKSLWKRSF